jgi:dTDP-4-dehydrorhamnose reductase
MKIMITGAAGRLGATIVLEMASAGHTVMALGRSDLDVTDRKRVRATVKALQPDVIINCTAYNAVDDAERHAATAFAVNAHGPANLAAEARGTALLVHFSSDFVFDGTATDPYTEDAPTNPLSVYGASKLAGEIETARAERHYVLRLESNFGGLCPGRRPATIDKMIDSILARRPVQAFADRTVSPSYVADAASATRAIIERGAPFGTYHCVNSGYATWYGLATAIARQVGVTADIAPIASASVKTAAARPLFCALSNRKLLAAGIDMPSWESALARHLAARGAFVPATVSRQACQTHS